METLENRLQKRIHVSLYALLFLVTLLGLSVLLEGCTDKCEVTNEYTYYEPVYTTIEDIRQQVELVAPQPIHAVGKLYFKDGFLFVNEPSKGIHIINNHDPAHPVPVNFLKIPGNFDLAVKGNTLYADSYVDLVAFDISNVTSVHEVSRLPGIFKNYQVLDFATDVNCCVITSWAEKKQVFINESDCQPGIAQRWGGIRYEGGIAFSSTMEGDFSAKAAIAPGTGSGSGVGGSLARFTISGDHLYLLDGGDLESVNISSEQNPVEKNRSFLAWDIETIFPYKTNLFIGSSSGMHIMDISTPESPVKVSTYQHVTSCDPVVVDGDYAYVTLRSGTTCQGFTNQLEVLDVKNAAAPQLLKTYPMTNPHGLGIDNKTLFICDGSDGLKTFDATDVLAIDQNQTGHYKDISALDVIPFDNILMMIGEDAIVQFDYSDPKNMKLLSKIEIAHAE
jgi:hypothetical protein